MRLEQLSYLIEITRLRSISRAAETLHISQPALSASVKSLETELGRTLFKRTNRGIFLTAARTESWTRMTWKRLWKLFLRNPKTPVLT